MWEILVKNKEWLFSGLAVFIIGGTLRFLWRSSRMFWRHITTISNTSQPFSFSESPFAVRGGRHSLLAHMFPRLYMRLIAMRLVRSDPRHSLEQTYLKWFISDMKQRNLGNLTYIPQYARLTPEPQLSFGDYRINNIHWERETIQKVRQNLLLLKDLVKGGNRATARIAATDQNTRVVRNVVSVLQWEKAPLVLLGDPGSGKSTNLRQVGINLAQKSLKEFGGLIPVYVPLGMYREMTHEVDFDDILALIKNRFNASHAAIRDHLDDYIQDCRLLVLFDGVDEMDRKDYNARVRKLSQFAMSHLGSIRCLFACRTNDLSPELFLRQVSLQSFDKRQVHAYIQANIKTPIQVEGETLNSRALADRLSVMPVLCDLSANPLTLYLLFQFLTVNKRWPAGRAELFDHFLEGLAQKLKAYSENAEKQLPDTKTVKRGWARFAYEIALHSGGTVVSLQEIGKNWSADKIESVLETGLRSGLLEVQLAGGAEPLAEFPETNRFKFENLHTNDAFGFFNHRIQEFLVAFHLSENQEQVLDWENLIDSPRWQETLLNLISIGGEDSAAFTVLERSFDELEKSFAATEAEISRIQDLILEKAEEISKIPKSRTYSGAYGGGLDYNNEERALYNQKSREKAELESNFREAQFQIPSPRERLWADQLVFASQVVSEMPREKEPTWRDQMVTGIKALARRGRPTSQVKMLWAWKNLPRLISMEDMPIRSENPWVRGQAISVLGSLPVDRKRWTEKLGEELAYDFVSERLWKSLPHYLKATRGRLQLILPLFLHTSCYFVYKMSILLAAICIIFFANKHVLPEHWNHGFQPVLQPVDTALLLIILSTLTSFILVPFGKSFLKGLLIGSTLCTTIIPLFFIFSLKPYSQWEYILIWIIYGENGFLFYVTYPLLIVATIVSISFFFTYSLAILLDTRPKRKQNKFSRLYMAFKYKNLKLEVVGLIVLAVVLVWTVMGRFNKYVLQPFYQQLKAFIVEMYTKIDPVLDFAWQAKIIWFPVLFFLAIVLIIKHKKARLIIGFFILLFFLLLISGIFFLAIVILEIVLDFLSPASGIVFYVFSIALFSTFALFVLYSIFVMILKLNKRVYIFYRNFYLRFIRKPKLRIAPSSWVHFVATGDPNDQMYYIENTDHHSVDQNPQEFLELLESVETKVSDPKVAAVYYQRRHDLEEALKQERTGSKTYPVAGQAPDPKPLMESKNLSA